MKVIYFDNNATTVVHPEVVQAMLACYESGPANPSSPHRSGRTARAQLEEARATVARILGAVTAGRDGDRVIFTSGGTEANNLALRGLVTRGASGRLFISSVEHPSVAVTAARMAATAWHVEQIEVDRNGIVNIELLISRIEATTALVSLILGNHETGVLQSLARIATRCAADRVPLHTDAVQVIGKLPVSFRSLGVTALSCSAHKFHGPPGIGALIVKHDALQQPDRFGGLQQYGLRAGTEPVALAVGMAKALAIWDAEQTDRRIHLTQLRDRFEEGLRRGWPGIVIHGAEAERLPHVSCIGFPGFDRQSLCMAFDLAGVACSPGSACTSGASLASPVLQAMGCGPALAGASLRFSFGAFNTSVEVDRALKYILNIYNNLRSEDRHRKAPIPPPASGPDPL